MKFVVALFVGAISAGDNMPVWELRSVQDHWDDGETNASFANFAADSANFRSAATPYASNFVQESSSDSDESSEDEEL